MSKSQFLKASEKYAQWCHQALVYWHEKALDPRGGYAEHLDMAGRPDFDHVRRVRVQSRLSYVYAHAAALGWYSDAQAASDQAWSFICEAGCQGNDALAPKKGCAHLVGGDGTLVDGMRDTYAQAFILLAAAWRFKAFKDYEALKMADDTVSFLNTHLSAPNGGWYESYPINHADTRRQNPHMHLFEAFLALFDATGHAKYLSFADNIFNLFERHFIDSETGLLREFFGPDWTTKGNGGPFEPGHMMEWVWLLNEYKRLKKNDVTAYCTRLYDLAISYGFSPKLGLICDVTHLDDKPFERTYRTWPQTEFIKACVARVQQGDESKLSVAAQAIESLFFHYLDIPENGGWVDQIDAEGHRVTEIMPSSTFYHLFCAAAEVDKLAKAL